MRNNEKASFNSDNNGLKRWDKWALGLLGFGVMLLVMPWLLTQPTWLSALDFSQSGQIGDTIGGITAPFMSLVGSGLVYLSFRMQVEMNRIQFRAITKQFHRNDEEDKEKSFNKLLEVLLSIKEYYSNEYKLVLSSNLSERGIARTLNRIISLYKANSEDTRYLSEMSVLSEFMDLLGVLIDLKNRIRRYNLEEEDQKLIYIQLHLFILSIEGYATIQYIRDAQIHSSLKGIIESKEVKYHSVATVLNSLDEQLQEIELIKESIN